MSGLDVFFIALRSLFYTIVAILFFGWAVFSVRTLDQRLGVLFPEWTEVPGIIVAVLGAILVFQCFGTFIVRGRGTPFVFDSPREFVAGRSLQICSQSDI